MITAVDPPLTRPLQRDNSASRYPSESPTKTGQTLLETPTSTSKKMALDMKAPTFVDEEPQEGTTILNNNEEEEDAEASLPIPSIERPVPDPPKEDGDDSPLHFSPTPPAESKTTPTVNAVKNASPKGSPVKIRGRSNSITAEDLARDKDATSDVKPSSHRSLTGGNNNNTTEGPKRVKRNKKKNASQRMRPKSHSPRKTAAGAGDGKPLMDLRQILQKHQKRSETQEMYNDDDDDDNSQHSGFYGSLSSIPFLHPDQEEKKPRKGKRTKKKDCSSLLPTSSCVKKSDPKKSPKREDSKQDDPTLEVTKQYTDADLRLWKSMTSQDGSFMEEVATRPNVMLQPREVSSSPKKKSASSGTKSPTTTTALATAQKHTERGFHRPDDWVEFGHPTKRSPKKLSYHSKDVVVGDDAVEIDSPAVYQQSKTRNEKKKGKDVVDQLFGDEKEAELEESKSSSPSKDYEENKVDDSIAKSSTLKETPPKTATTSSKKYKKTCLAIAFDDGCVISGDFRPKERIERVILDLQRDLLRRDVSLPEIELFVQKDPGSDSKERLDPNKTLRDSGLVPSGTVFVHWKAPVATKESPGWYLKTE
ncbi:MAG: hypothetical protein SGILL_000675 [Bacillariaceae sp.]